MTFIEFLQDYEVKEMEELHKYGEYPKKERFIKLKDPIASAPVGFNIWGIVPFDKYLTKDESISEKIGKFGFD